MKKEEKTQKQKDAKVVGTAECSGKDCPNHGSLKTRGRSFEGTVIKRFPKRLTVELQRMIYIKKYERYAKIRSKIHARVPECMEKEIKVGDRVRIQECRPLSKIIHFVVVKKIKDVEEGK